MPTFRFQSSELAEMEAAAQQVTGSIFPSNDVIEALTAKFNAAPERSGKFRVYSKQVLTWFHNRRYAPRSKEIKARKQAQLAQGETLLRRRASSSSGNRRMENNQLLGQMMPPPGNPVRRHSTPFQQGECGDVHCRDLVLCLQECDGIPVHCEARVLATQRKRHAPSKCDCKFLVCFEHDKTEVIVPFEKLRRPPVDNYRVPKLRCVLSTEADIDELTSNENNDEQRDPNQGKLMGVNIYQAIMECKSEQEKSSSDGVDAFPATSPETCNASASDVGTGSVKAAPEIIVIDDD